MTGTRVPLREPSATTVRTGRTFLVGAVALACVCSCSSSTSPGTGQASSSLSAVATSAAAVSPRGSASTPSPARPRDVTAVIKLGSATPNGLAVGFGSVWVVNHPTGVLERINPTNGHVREINLGPWQMCMRPWIGAGHVWVGGCSYGNTTSPGTTWVVDPSTGRVKTTVPAYAEQAAFLGSSVWLLNQNYSAVLRFNARTYKPTGSVAVHGLPVAAGGYLWIVGQQLDTGQDLRFIAQVDPRTDKVIRRIPTPTIGMSGRTIAAYGALWEIGLGTGKLLRLDLKTHQVRVFELAGDASLTEDYEIYPLAAAGSLWVRIADDTIDRIDPRSGKVTATYPGDPQSAGMLTYGFGSLWVANVQAGTVWRESVH